MTDTPTTAAEMPAVFYVWRNEPNGEWVVSDGSTPYPAFAHIRAFPLPSDDGMVERVADNPAVWSALQDYVKAAKYGGGAELRQAIVRAAIAAMRGE